MANPRVKTTCKRCGQRREHYTRKNKTRVSPCVTCSTELATERAQAKATDPAFVEKRRAQYARYNASKKGMARLKRSRSGIGRVPEQDELSESEPAEDGKGAEDLSMKGFL